MKYVLTKILRQAAATSAYAVLLTAQMQAASIAENYSLTGVGTVQGATPTTLTLAAVASGALTSSTPGLNSAWNPISYSDVAVLHLTTALVQFLRRGRTGRVACRLKPISFVRRPEQLARSLASLPCVHLTCRICTAHAGHIAVVVIAI